MWMTGRRANAAEVFESISLVHLWGCAGPAGPAGSVFGRVGRQLSLVENFRCGSPYCDGIGKTIAGTIG